MRFLPIQTGRTLMHIVQILPTPMPYNPIYTTEFNTALNDRHRSKNQRATTGNASFFTTKKPAPCPCPASPTNTLNINLAGCFFPAPQRRSSKVRGDHHPQPPEVFGSLPGPHIAHPAWLRICTPCIVLNSSNRFFYMTAKCR